MRIHVEDTVLAVAPPSEPLVEQPGLRPGLVRRTSSLDAVLVDDVTLRLTGSGRDADVDDEGSVGVAGHASVEADVDVAGRSVAAIGAAADGRPIDVAAMMGTTLGGGFRRALSDRVHVEAVSLAALLLDELPGGGIIAGVALIEAGIARTDPRYRGRVPLDVCAGWAEGGTMATAVRNGGNAYRGPGPTAAPPELACGDGWHDAPPLTAGAVRRRRRVDVHRETGGDIRVDAWFRDAYAEPAGAERVIHEYRLLATVEPHGLTVTDIVALPLVLPAEECPTAAASARRLLGPPLFAVRDRVRASFTGPSTCTHLNDALRALGDVWALVRQLEAARSPRYSSRNQRL